VNENSELPQTKKSRWRDTNVLIGIVGVIATIAVGVITYWLTAGSVSREYQERIKAARNDVLTAVARSIGEGVVPGKDKIQSVLNSVRRQYGIREQDFETPDTVIDDVLTRVLANEFLDAKRREDISTKLLLVKAEKGGAEEMKAADAKPQRLEADRFAALAIAIAAATLAAMTLTIMAGRFKRIIREVGRDSVEAARRRERLELVTRQVLMMATALAGIVLAMWFFFITGKAPALWPFIQR